MIAGTEQYDEKLLRKLTNLRMISRVGIGVDNINLDVAKELGIQITNTPDELIWSICYLNAQFFCYI